mgnify:FL=1
MTFGIGNSMGFKPGSWQQYTAHAVAQGTFSHIRGNKFIHGAVAGLAGKSASEITGGVDAIQGQSHVITRTLIAGSMGWLAAKATDGDAHQAFLMAATVHLYNAEGEELFGQKRVTVTQSVDGDNHEYRVRGLICSASSEECSASYADQVFESVNQNDVPFSDKDLGSGNKNLISWARRPFGSQPIYHSEDITNRTSVNITMEGHNFHPGDVTHRVHFENGNLYYDMVGIGTGSFPGFNNWVGIKLFGPGVQSAVDKFGM